MLGLGGVLPHTLSSSAPSTPTAAAGALLAPVLRRENLWEAGDWGEGEGKEEGAAGANAAKRVRR